MADEVPGPTGAKDAGPKDAARMPAGAPVPPASRGLPPGVCLPFEDKIAYLDGVAGDVGIVKGEWERLEGQVYLYLWSWIA